MDTISTPTAAPPSEPLADQSWLVDLLRSAGFERISADTFSNGKATLKFNGRKFTADPGHGDQSWSADFADADAASIQTIIQQILKTRPFLSDAVLAKESAEKRRLEQALLGIAGTIRQGPDTHSGVQLRRFLWSLYNEHHLVNLWRLTAVLDSEHAQWVSEILAGGLVGPLEESDIKRALQAAGEMERWDSVKLSAGDLEQLIEAERTIESLLKTIPPCRSHTELNRARESLLEAKAALRRTKDSPAS